MDNDVVIPRCEALLFDLDGTLVDSRRDIAEALNTSLAEIGRPALAFEAILPMIGDGARALVARALLYDVALPATPLGPALSQDDDVLVERVRVIFERAYAAKPCVYTTLLPGAAAAMAIDVPRAIITNKPRALTLLVLEGLLLRETFPVVRAGGDGPMKPSPDGIYAVVKELGVNVQNAWMIGDGPQDVLAGHAAGCFTIAVPGIAERDRVVAAKPHLIVQSLHDVAKLALQSRQPNDDDDEVTSA